MWRRFPSGSWKIINSSVFCSWGCVSGEDLSYHTNISPLIITEVVFVLYRPDLGGLCTTVRSAENKAVGWMKKQTNNLNGFGGPGWSRSVETTYKEEVECALEAAPLVVGAGAVDLAGGKENSPGFFLEVLGKERRFSEVG